MWSALGVLVLGLTLMLQQLQAPDYRTGTAAMRTLTLSDGSELVLGADTAIDVRFSTAHRCEPGGLFALANID